MNLLHRIRHKVAFPALVPLQSERQIGVFGTAADPAMDPPPIRVTQGLGQHQVSVF